MDTLYERANATRRNLCDGFALGRITKVFSEDRLVEVKTFFGTGVKDDNHIPKAQWISLDSHPEGDESGALPRVNSYCLVFYIQGEALVFGSFSPANKKGKAGDNKEPLNDGDRILKTIAGNKIILRSHGEIQIESTNSCRTTWFPDRDMINTLCRNYEFVTDGGTVGWQNIDENDNTLYVAEFRDNISRTNIITEEKGFIDDELISRTEIGTSDDKVWTKTIKKTGETELFIRKIGAASGYKHTILPDGTTTLVVADKTTVKIIPSGEVSIDVANGKSTITLSASGEVSVVSKGKVSLTTDNELSIKTKGNMVADVGGTLNVKTKGPTNVDSGGPVTLKAKGNIFNGQIITSGPHAADPITGIIPPGVGGIVTQ